MTTTSKSGFVVTKVSDLLSICKTYEMTLPSYIISKGYMALV